MTITIRSAPTAVFNPHTVAEPNQTAPAVTALAGGGYVTVWRSDGQDNGVAGEGGIYSRLADASGAFVGGEILVNTTTAGSQSLASAEALPGGGYVVSWISGAAGSTVGYFQRFDSTGAKIGGETAVGAAGSVVQSLDIASLGDNGFWAVWSGAGGVSAQRYDASGAKVGGVVSVTNSEASGNPVRADAGADGGLMVTWTGRDQAFPFSTDDQIKVRHIDAAGATGPQMATTNPGGSLIVTINPTVTALAGGGYVVAFAPMLPAVVSYQMYDADGAAVGPLRQANASVNAGGAASIAPLADGGFVIGWNGVGGVRLQIVGADGERVGNEVLLAGRLGNVNDFLAGMTLTVLADGSIVAAWQDRATGSPADIKMVRLDAVHSSTLSAGAEIATGDGADDLFLAAASAIGAGDQIAGGAGDDTLQLTTTGRADFTGVALHGLETLRGSAGDDTLVFSGAPTGVGALDSGGGHDVLELAGGVDLADLPQLSGDWRIRAPSGSIFTITGAYQAPVFDPSMATVIIDASGYALSTAARAQLFAQGVDEIRQPSGYVFFASTTTVGGEAVVVSTLSASADTIAADAGPQLVITRPQDLGAADSLSGGGGVDRLELSEAGILDLTAPAAFSGFEIIAGSLGNDRFIVSAARLAGITHLLGGDGDDVLQFAGDLDLSAIQLQGIELVQGSAGDDRLTIAAAAGLTVDGGAGYDTVVLTAAATQDLTSSHFTGVEVVQGTAAEEVFKLAGGVQTFRVDGNGGGTLVTYETATSGAVMSLGHIGAGVVVGSGYGDLLVGTGIADVINAGDGDDILIGYGGADTLNGQAGSDILYGQDGDDLLSDGNSSLGQDFLFGGRGNDTYIVNSSFDGPTDIVYEGGDNPDLMAGAGDVDTVRVAGVFWRDYYSVAEKIVIENLFGSQVVGGVNDQEINGYVGRDTIYAYGGSNRIDAGAGTDFIVLGLYDLPESADGVNTIVMKAGSGMDYVYDFESGVDKIDLTAFNFGITGAQVLAQVVTVDNPGTVDDYSYLYLTNAGGVDNFVIFMGLQASQLQAQDFIT